MPSAGDIPPGRGARSPDAGIMGRYPLDPVAFRGRFEAIQELPVGLHFHAWRAPESGSFKLEEVRESHPECLSDSQEVF